LPRGIFLLSDLPRLTFFAGARPGKRLTGVSLVAQQSIHSQPPRGWRRADSLLLALFLLSLPLLNPWVRGDGVGYYAFARAPLFAHNFDFAPDYQQANTSFREGRLDEFGQPRPEFRTRTGHLDNHFTVGPALLWTPFLLLAHAGVLIARLFGSSVSADGFSSPYRIAMALGTAVYGFLGLLLSFRLARQYIEERWALLATISIWWASSLPVYMYFNPSWSHAHSAFAVALFLWYWHETRGFRSLPQWLLLGAITGLMLNVYYANFTILVVLVWEAVSLYLTAFRGRSEPGQKLPQLLSSHLLFGATVIICMLPTFISRYIIYGGIFETGYIPLREWFWSSPYLLAVLFSANHGLLSWTPIILLSFAGLVLFCKLQPRLGGSLLAAALAFYFLIACYPDWAGISSYGNRFFLSLTAIFVLGLGVFLESISALLPKPRPALAAASAFLFCFIVWNVGFMFQWGSHLVPARGPISFSEVVHNQFFVVPKQIAANLQSYLFKRKAMMQQIEEHDIEQMKKAPQD
jgi:hypothetical protein